MIDKKTKDLHFSCFEKLEELRHSLSVPVSRKHTSDEGNDSIDKATNDRFLHDSFYFKDKMIKQLAEVESALNRIQTGTYGICEVTGESIEPNRLLAIPWTRISLAALEELEIAG